MPTTLTLSQSMCLLIIAAHKLGVLTPNNFILTSCENHLQNGVLWHSTHSLEIERAYIAANEAAKAAGKISEGNEIVGELIKELSTIK